MKTKYFLKLKIYKAHNMQKLKIVRINTSLISMKISKMQRKHEQALNLLYI